jgi:hypothetical protein
MKLACIKDFANQIIAITKCIIPDDAAAGAVSVSCQDGLLRAGFYHIL